MFENRQPGGSTSPSDLDRKTLQLLDGLAKAPTQSCMSTLNMIQNHGEYEASSFPAKHRFAFNIGEGLALRGYSDTWVNPPFVSVELRFNGGPVPPSVEHAFTERTGRNLHECALYEVQRRLDSGEFTPTLRQKLNDFVQQRPSSQYRETEQAIQLIHAAVERSTISDWKSSDYYYNRLKGRGYLLNVSDMDDQAPFSCLHPHTPLVIGVSATPQGPIIELGYRALGSGDFVAQTIIEGPPAQEVLAGISKRVEAFESKLAAERGLLENDLVSTIAHGPLEDWVISRSGDTLTIRSKRGNFSVAFEAHERASYEGIASVVAPRVRAYSQSGPRFIEATPTESSIVPAFEKILVGRADAGAVLADRFDERSAVGRHLLERVAAHLKSFSSEDVRAYYRHWHAHQTSLRDARWQITTSQGNAQGRPEYAVVSDAGISVGCWRGGRSGGYQEAFVFTSPEARALAQATLTRIETMRLVAGEGTR